MGQGSIPDATRCSSNNLHSYLWLFDMFLDSHPLITELWGAHFKYGHSLGLHRKTLPSLAVVATATFPSSLIDSAFKLILRLVCSCLLNSKWMNTISPAHIISGIFRRQPLLRNISLLPSYSHQTVWWMSDWMGIQIKGELWVDCIALFKWFPHLPIT